MAEEVMIENVLGESDEAESWESDEAFEAEDSAEDIWERVRRSRQPGRFPTSFRAKGWAGGVTLRTPDGKVRKIPFPTKLATAAETNRGLASQEIARRALDERLDQLEKRLLVQQKRDSSASGLVSLAIGLPLAAWGFIRPKESGGTRFENWASEETTKMATLTAATQIVTSGAKLLINRRYHSSGIGIAADAFAAVQIAAFLFASGQQLSEADEERSEAIIRGKLDSYAIGTRIYALEDQTLFRVEVTKRGTRFLVPES